MRKIKFKEFLNEYRKAPLTSPLGIFDLANFLSDKDNVEILPTSIPFETTNIIINEYSFDTNNKCFILTDRINLDSIIGYMIITKVENDFWRVNDVYLFPPFQNKGVGINLYVNIINFGYTLIHGYSLSDQAEIIWIDKLPKIVDVKVYDKQTNEILDFTDLPQSDKHNNESQRYFYIAKSEKTIRESIDYLEDNHSNNLAFIRWLQGEHLIFGGKFRHQSYASKGEF